MITFVTDIRSPKESDVLRGYEHCDLVLTSLSTEERNQEFHRVPAPKDGWNHEALCCYATLIETGEAYLASPGVPLERDVAHWIGSSEV